MPGILGLKLEHTFVNRVQIPDGGWAAGGVSPCRSSNQKLVSHLCPFSSAQLLCPGLVCIPSPGMHQGWAEDGQRLEGFIREM